MCDNVQDRARETMYRAYRSTVRGSGNYGKQRSTVRHQLSVIFVMGAMSTRDGWIYIIYIYILLQGAACTGLKYKCVPY